MTTTCGALKLLHTTMATSHARNQFVQCLAAQFPSQYDVGNVHGILAGVEEEQRFTAPPKCVHITGLGIDAWC